MVNKLGLGMGMVGHGAMRALDRPALLSGSCSCFVFLRVVSNNVIKVRGGVKGSVKSVATRSCTYLECLTSLLMVVTEVSKRSLFSLKKLT